MSLSPVDVRRTALGATLAGTTLWGACASLPVQDVHPHCGTARQRSTYFCPATYMDYSPPVGPIIRSTNASLDTYLYGARGDADADRDGIGDKRFPALEKLAERFSPILVKNNIRGEPWHVDDALRLEWVDDLFTDVRCTGAPEMVIDRWNRANSRPTVSRRAIPLGAYVRGTRACERQGPSRVPDEAELAELYAEFGPEKRRLTPASPHSDLDAVLYFDFPGYHEESWRVAYRAAARRLDPHIYAHFFVEPEPGTELYRLIIQYWFFYPHNDGGNNHEGDWEHINVHVGLGDAPAGAFEASQLASVLEGAYDDAQLEIARVDYYFHRKVFTLDYLNPEALYPRHARLQYGDWKFVPRAIRARKKRFKTHPVAFIGADNTGLDQILTRGGDRNRNSHGTYPFFGTWKRIGPFGATERIHEEWNHRSGEPVEADASLDEIPVWKDLEARPDWRGRFLRFDRTNITLIPDYERLLELTTRGSGAERAAARRDWAWLLLPIRWGFPVTEWAGGSIAAGSDNGQAAPVGPAFNSGWNRSGPSAGYAAYEPYVFREEFGLGFQDNFHTRAGFLAYLASLRDLLIVPLPLNLYSFGRRLGDSSDPKFLPRTEDRTGRHRIIPFNAFTLSLRGFRSFWRGDSGVAAKLAAGGGGAFAGSEIAGLRPVRKAAVVIDRGTSPFGLSLGVHAGRFTTRFDAAFSEAVAIFPTVDEAGAQRGMLSSVRRDLLIAGTYRHRFFAGGFSPYAMAGYGYHLWWLDEFALNGQPVDDSRTNTFWPSWLWILPLPNTTHFGGGLDWFPEPGYAAGEPELGAFLELTYRTGSLGRYELAGGVSLSF